MIHFDCPTCGKTFQVKDEFGGSRTKCPACGETIRVPPSIAGPIQPARRPASPSSREPQKNSKAPLFLGLGAGAFVLVLGTIAVTVWATGVFSKSTTGQQARSEVANPKTEQPKAGEQPPATAPMPPKAQPSPDPLKEDPKFRAFKEKVAHFLEEARVGAKLMTLAPSLADATEKARHIKDLYTRLPEVPPGVDPTGKVAERLKNINGSFAYCQFLVKQALDFERLKAVDQVKKIYGEDLPRAGKTVNEYATEIELMLGLQPPAQRHSTAFGREGS